MKKILIFLAFMTSLSFLSTLQAMEKEQADEEPYQLSKQEKQLESYRIQHYMCKHCPPGGPPKLGVPLIGTEKLMYNTVYGQTVLYLMTQEEKDQELQKQLTNFGSTPTWWHDRYIVFFCSNMVLNSQKKPVKNLYYVVLF